MYVHNMTDDKTKRFEMRVQARWLADIDAWRREQAAIPSRAEAIRFLAEVGAKAIAIAEAEILIPADEAMLQRDRENKFFNNLRHDGMMRRGPGAYFSDPDCLKHDPDPD